MADKITPTWGYHASQAPKVFHLTEGQNLPDGWHDHPDKAKAAGAAPVDDNAANSKPADESGKANASRAVGPGAANTAKA